MGRLGGGSADRMSGGRVVRGAFLVGVLVVLGLPP